MKLPIIGIVSLFFATDVFAANPPAIIPQPEKVELRDGSFRLAPNTRIYVDFASRPTGKMLAARLRQSTGYKFPVVTKLLSSAPVGNDILLTTKSARTNLGPEGYELTASANSVVIRAPAQAGVFYGTRTLLQLLPPEIFSTNIVAGKDWQMPCVQIEDQPRFKWRGLMLDVSRHFYSKQEVEQLLDLMALYKLNVFHWHLTDDQGWRIQIKKYPKLTQIGAWRSASVLTPPGVKPEDLSKGNAHPSWTAPSADKFGPSGRYGGFYTQDDIREVVKYAAARHITIVPEIEMPGHSVAALAAYPQFSCTGGPFSTDVHAGVNHGIYCVGNAGTYVFLQNILTEVFRLFPGKYIHIGGDEVPTDEWQHDPKDQAVIQREGLKDAGQLESYFIRRMEKFINAHGKTLVGWSEIRNGGLAKSAVVMDWIGGGKEAASAGHDVVMTPIDDCYFDHYQSANHSQEPHAIGGYLPLNKVYSFEPVPKDLARQFQSHVLGGQANLWTEYIASLPYAEYMLFPRLDALAEAVWSPKDARNWADFQRRLAVDEQRLNELGVNYRRDRSDIGQ
jgi:hexosaminidase